MKFLKAVLVAISVSLSAPAFAQPSTSSNMEILRQKVKADKKLLVAANMDLTEAQAKVFWPVYDAYQGDLEKINRRLAAMIQTYGNAYLKGSVPDDVARKLLAESISVDEAEAALKRTYVPRLEKAIPATKAVRYLQIENKIRAVVRFDLAAEIPLAD
ncbi:MAG: hypothetical protein RIS35_2251 [Pseudomonadota bacterium]|jgi:hypothetical protein